MCKTSSKVQDRDPALLVPAPFASKALPPVSAAGHFLIGRVSGLRASKRRSARRVDAALMRGALGRRLPATGDYIASRGATNTAVRRGHEMECARGVARARDAVDADADAGAGDATTDVLGQDDASSRSITRDSLLPDPPQHSPSRASALKSCGVSGVRALGARDATP